ncbi:hypothetical protein GC163_08220 [bacterium]|nr:hypothetical protein [bacterium]
MFHSRKLAITFLPLVAVALAVGCQTQTPPATPASSAQASHGDHSAEADDSKVLASLARLSPQDQALAKAQQFCALMNQSRLGSMGTPIKFEIKGEPVFVCCSGCKAKALKNPDETLAKVAALKAGNTADQ